MKFLATSWAPKRISDVGLLNSNASITPRSIAGTISPPGNCATELLLGFLKNPKFHLRPVLKCIQEHLLPLKEQMEWGPSIPYIITGQLNRHPRAAIAMRQGEDPDDYVRFYDQMTEEE